MLYSMGASVVFFLCVPAVVLWILLRPAQPTSVADQKSPPPIETPSSAPPQPDPAWAPAPRRAQVLTLGTAAGLVARWKLDEADGATARDSTGRHHGKLVGRPARVPGKKGNGLRLHGKGDHVTTGFNRQLEFWTIALWVQGEHAPRADAPTGPIHRERNFHINWDCGDPRHCASAMISAGRVWQAASFGSLEGSRWYHLAATFDGENLHAYRDGALVTTTRVQGVPDREWAPLVLGKHAVHTDYFVGVIDDVCVYDRPLSKQDINHLMLDP
jgi:hypothetical protein